jgi:competence protein ComEC
MFKKLLVALSLFVLILASYWAYWNFEPRLHIYFLNIGQGDAILIRTPDEKYFLIDGGPSQPVLLQQLSEILPPWQHRIDYIMPTHPDADHVTGLVGVLQNYEVGEVLINLSEHQTKIWDQLKLLAAAKNHEDVDANSDFTIGCCLKIDFLWPYPQHKIEDTDTNSRSISLIMSYKNFSAYFDGDLPSKYQDELIGLRDVEVLKVTHHGSKTATDSKFLEKITPELDIISVGKNNKYGHPNKETLNNLTNANVRTLRTDLQGRIEVISDGTNYWY